MKQTEQAIELSEFSKRVERAMSSAVLDLVTKEFKAKRRLDNYKVAVMIATLSQLAGIVAATTDPNEAISLEAFFENEGIAIFKQFLKNKRATVAKIREVLG